MKLTLTMGVLHFLVKYTLFLLNLIFTLAGIAITVVGALIHIKIQELSESFSNQVIAEEGLKTLLHILSVSAIVLGCIVFVIAFLGCCGAVTETKCLLVTFAVFMFFVIVAKIYLTVVWSRDIDSLRHSVNDYINNAFDDPAQNVTFHGMEATLNCCGTTGPESYEILPPTCCPIEGTIDFETVCLLEDAFGIGCLELIDNFIYNIAHTVKTVLICVTVFEALELIGAVYLSISINKSKEKPNYYH